MDVSGDQHVRESELARDWSGEEGVSVCVKEGDCMDCSTLVRGQVGDEGEVMC